MSLAENKKAVVAFFRRTFNEKDPEGAARDHLWTNWSSCGTRSTPRSGRNATASGVLP
jgi:hypothetical protein